MADWLTPSNAPAAGQTPGQVNDISTKLQIGNQILARMLDLFTNLFPRSNGTFTMAASASKTITDANVKTTSVIPLTATNAAAGTLMGSAKSLYVTAGNGSFTVTTASGVAAAGSETFSYSVLNTI